MWFVNADKTMVRQIQRDRLIQNWRRLKPDDAYPHYEKLRPSFVAAFNDLQHFCQERLDTGLWVTQCEVELYQPNSSRCSVREDRTESREDSGSVVWKLQRLLPSRSRTRCRPGLHSPSGEPMECLSAVCTSAPTPAIHAPTGAQVLLLQLAARGRPIGDDGLDAAMKFLNLGPRMDRSGLYIVYGANA